MFPFGTYDKIHQNTANHAVVQDVTAIMIPDKEALNGSTQDVHLKEIAETMSDTTSNLSSGESVPFKMEVDADIANLMTQVNDGLERELKDMKKALKRIFKELVAFHKVAQKIHAKWVPIREAEFQEAQRLDELQAEVEGTIGALPGFRRDIPPSDTQYDPPSSN
jgi:hypothetical protein